MMKAILLLAMALFLVCAPEPDARTLAEMTAHFIVVDDQTALQAAEEPAPREQVAIGSPAEPR